MENNVMQQTTDLAQMTAAINDIVPAGSNVVIDVPEQPNNGPTTFTRNMVPSTGSKVRAFAAGAGAAAAVVTTVIGIRWLIKKHKEKKAAAAAQATTTEVPQEEFVDEV